MAHELELNRRDSWCGNSDGTVVPARKADRKSRSAGPVKVLLTGNGINEQVRSVVAAQSKRDVFLDARKFAL